jgi:hypothetical protein
MKKSYYEEANNGSPIQLFRKPKGQIPYSKSPSPVPDKFTPQAKNGLFKINFNIILRPMTNVRNGLLSPGMYSYLPTDIFIPRFITSSERNT